MELKEYPAIGEKAYYDTLPNGLRIVVVPKPGFRRDMAFFAANYGGADRRFRSGGTWIDTPAGVAHFLEHKMFDMPDGSNALTTLSSRGAGANAFTSADMTAYHFDCVDGFEENLKTLLQFVSTAYFTPESVEKERGIIGQEILMSENDPDSVIYYDMLRSLFRRNPVRESILGTEQTIAEITPEVLYACHRAFYNPSNMVLVTAGNQPPEKIAEIAMEIIPERGAGRPERDYGREESAEPVQAFSAREMDVGIPMYLTGVKTAGNLSGRRAAKFEMTAMLTLGSLFGRSSKLYDDLYNEGLINDTFTYDFEISAGISYLMFGGESRDHEAVNGRIIRAAKALAANGPDPDFFARWKNAVYGRMLSGFNSFDNICYGVANSVFMGYDYFEMPSVISSVSGEDAADFAGRYFDPSLMAVSLISSAQR